MDYVAITLSLPPAMGKPKDLLLPLDVPQYVLLEALIESLEINVPYMHKGSLSVIENEKKKKLPWKRTLRDAGLMIGQTVVLEFEAVSARASLICRQGPEFDLEKDEMVIGCRSDMDIDLRSIPYQEFVSGQHAVISSKDGCYYLADLNSTNGTKLNGIGIPANQVHVLRDGDEILLGIEKEKGIQLILKIRK